MYDSHTSYADTSISAIDRWLYYLWKDPQTRARCETTLRLLASRFKCFPFLSDRLDHLLWYFHCGGKTRDRPDMRYIKLYYLGRKLKRRKSLSSMEDGFFARVFGKKKRYQEQRQSPLFAKLPLEIRLQIYTYMFQPDAAAHIRSQTLDGFFSAYDCHCEDDLHLIWERYGEYRLRHLDCCGCPRDLKLWQPLPLLMSCRRIYSETINLLYSTKSFGFSFDPGFTTLLCAIPQPRHADLRSIVLYCVPDSYHLWPIDMDYMERNNEGRMKRNNMVRMERNNYHLLRLIMGHLQTMTNLRECRIILQRDLRIVSLVLDNLQNGSSDWPHRRAFSIEIVSQRKSHPRAIGRGVKYRDLEYELVKVWTADDDLSTKDIHEFCACKGSMECLEV